MGLFDSFRGKKLGTAAKSDSGVAAKSGKQAEDFGGFKIVMQGFDKAQVNTKILELTRRVHSLEEDKKKLQVEIDKRSGTDDLTVTVKKLEDELSIVRYTAETKTSLAEELQKELLSITEELNELKDNLAASSQADALAMPTGDTAKVAELEDELAARDRKILGLSDDVDVLTFQLNKVKQDLEVAREQAQSVHETVVQVEDKESQKESQEEITRLKAQIKFLNEEITSLNDEIIDLKLGEDGDNAYSAISAPTNISAPTKQADNKTADKLDFSDFFANESSDNTPKLDVKDDDGFADFTFGGNDDIISEPEPQIPTPVVAKPEPKQSNDDFGGFEFGNDEDDGFNNLFANPNAPTKPQPVVEHTPPPTQPKIVSQPLSLDGNNDDEFGDFFAAPQQPTPPPVGAQKSSQPVPPPVEIDEIVPDIQPFSAKSGDEGNDFFADLFGSEDVNAVTPVIGGVADTEILSDVVEPVVSEFAEPAKQPVVAVPLAVEIENARDIVIQRIGHHEKPKVVAPEPEPERVEITNTSGGFIDEDTDGLLLGGDDIITDSDDISSLFSDLASVEVPLNVEARQHEVKKKVITPTKPTSQKADEFGDFLYDENEPVPAPKPHKAKVVKPSYDDDEDEGQYGVPGVAPPQQPNPYGQMPYGAQAQQLPPGMNPYGQMPYGAPGQMPPGMNPYGQMPYGQMPYGAPGQMPGMPPYGQMPYGMPYGFGGMMPGMVPGMPMPNVPQASAKDDDDDDDGALLFDEDGNLVPVMNTNAALGPAEKKKEKKSTAPKYPSLSGGMGYKAPEPPPKKGLKGVVSSVKKKPE